MEYIELKIAVSPRNPWTEIIIADLAEHGFESFVETDEGVLAYGSEADVNFEAPVADTILATSSEEFSFELTSSVIPKQNWNAEWEADFHPVHVDEYCTILAPFHDSNVANGLPILIQPQMSFGTGHHQTTYLMTKALFELDNMPERVLDMGTGTGVLAIVAEKLGAKYILAVDIEEWSVENTIENAQRNQCKNIEGLLGDIDQIPAQKFGLILANINKNVLKAHLSHYANRMEKDAILLLSGFFTTDADELISLAESCGLTFVKMRDKETWACLELIKN